MTARKTALILGGGVGGLVTTNVLRREAPDCAVVHDFPGHETDALASELGERPLDVSRLAIADQQPQEGRCEPAPQVEMHRPSFFL